MLSEGGAPPKARQYRGYRIHQPLIGTEPLNLSKAGSGHIAFVTVQHDYIVAGLTVISENQGIVYRGNTQIKAMNLLKMLLIQDLEVNYVCILGK